MEKILLRLDEIGPEDRAVLEGRRRLCDSGMGDADRLPAEEVGPAFCVAGYTPSLQEVPPPPPDAGSRRVRQMMGQPASRGFARGTARVVGGPSDAFDFRQGMLLVCDSIDSTITFILPLYAGIIERRDADSRRHHRTGVRDPLRDRNSRSNGDHRNRGSGECRRLRRPGEHHEAIREGIASGDRMNDRNLWRARSLHDTVQDSISSRNGISPAISVFVSVSPFGMYMRTAVISMAMGMSARSSSTGLGNMA